VYLILVVICLVIFLTAAKLMEKKIVLDAVWSIKVFTSKRLITKHPEDKFLEAPTLTAADVTDVSAKFIADPFILLDRSSFYMFFEVLDKSSKKGIIGLATSNNGENWHYEKIVLKENYHLSYPYVFKNLNNYYMIPESTEANKVFLYKAKKFPLEWEIECELLNGRYADCSVFQYKNKWWMFAGNSGKLHLFFSDELKGEWIEHPNSPLISNNYNITRPAGRVIVDQDNIYRYTQDGQPYYGSSVKVFKVISLSEDEYLEEELGLILSGTKKDLEMDMGLNWRKDGMHHIDQIKINDNQWLVVVDGHKFNTKNYLLWKFNNIIQKAQVF
jgi:hypothetical protein